MEAWTTVIVAFIVAASTLSATFLTNWLSNKRFERELARQIEVGERQRKWEVRGEPLLKMRAELAIMATKLEKLAKSGNSFAVPAKTVEQVKEALKKAENDWNNYVEGDYLEKVLYSQSQSDAEIVNRVREIRNEYLDTYYDVVVTGGKGLSATEFGKAARAAEEKLRPKVGEVQELINKRLEKL